MMQVMRLLRRANFSGAKDSFLDPTNYTNTLQPINKSPKQLIYRVIDLQGELVGKKADVDSKLLNRIYRTMIYTEEMDTILLKAKGQGKISFYMTSFGETGTTVGVGAALEDRDYIFPQYREQGTFLWRGYTLEEIINQCMGNSRDAAKGRQMPVHYGSPKLNIITVSSPLTTQVPQASGAGYAFRTSNEDRVAATFFGEGAASEGDFHSAMNFAATLRSQTLFLCRNNKYAISTPTEDQYKSDGISPRAIGYGMQSMKVDGNDAIAVYEAVKFARKHIVEHKEPFFIEFMTYRLGDHSTSDNSNLYRAESEKEVWARQNNPILRLASYLSKQNLKETTDKEDESFRKNVRQEVIDMLRKCGEYKKPRVMDLFTDVYDKMTPNLIEQERELEEHLKTYADKYGLEHFDK